VQRAPLLVVRLVLVGEVLVDLAHKVALLVLEALLYRLEVRLPLLLRLHDHSCLRLHSPLLCLRPLSLQEIAPELLHRDGWGRRFVIALPGARSSHRAHLATHV